MKPFPKGWLALVLLPLTFGAFLFLTNAVGTSAPAEKSLVLAKTGEAVRVRTHTVRVEGFTETLDYAGTTEASRRVVVVSETAGRVVQEFVRKGQFVREGQPIAVVESQLRELSVKTARIQLAQARRQAERLRALRAEGNASVADLEAAELALSGAEAALEQAERALTDATVRAPLSGIFYEKTVERGSQLAPGVELGHVADVATLKVVVRIPEQEIFRLKPGQPAHLVPDALPDQPRTGRVAFIGTVADASRTFPVEIALANGGPTPLKVGQSVRVAFRFAQPAVLALPRAALIGSVQQPDVYVVRDSVVTRRRLVLGQAHGETLEVKQGLQVGETVVTAGQRSLFEGAKVAVQ